MWEVTGETIVAASRADRTSQQHFEEGERRKGFQAASETVGEWAYLVQTLLFQEKNKDLVQTLRRRFAFNNPKCSPFGRLLIF